jgi:putative Ca2+/H+ antiporter (TMEM165/GDT1 family)
MSQDPADTDIGTDSETDIDTGTATPADTADGTAPDMAAAGSFGAVFLTTFTTVFLAELGDKTQLAALLLSAESGRPVIVFIGASLALISSSLVGVLLGRWLAKVLPPQQLERLAGILMIGLGLWLGRQAAVSMLPLTT